MSNICINCVKDSHLKQLVSDEGAKGVCSLCGSNDAVMDTESNRFFQLTKALVRFYYSEWDYNTHWGGEGYHSLFYGDDNIFFIEERSISDESYDDVVQSINNGPFYEEYKKGITVFAGYGPNGMDNMLLESIKNDLDNDILKIAERLKTENHFVLENEVKSIIERYRKVATSSIVKSESLYRARIGFEKKIKNLDADFVPEYHYMPYAGADIGAPPPHLSMGGRVNRSGVSFLYCATDKYTAISEVRPHPGDRISLAKFCVNHDLSVYDLANSKLLHFFENDESLDKYKTFNTLGVLLNRTVPPSDRIHYSITQLIADCIRQLGFDGIIFNSTVGEGNNVVLFDEKVVDHLTDDADVVLIDLVKFEFKQEVMVNDDKYIYM